MKIDTMRRVDYFAGIPLCLLATLLVRLGDFLRARRRHAPERVLFVELSEMGSAILVDPAMRKMQREGKTDLYFLIFKSNAASLRLLGTVPLEQVFTIRESSFITLALDTLRFLVWARRQRIDTVIDLELFSRYSALLTGLCGAVNRVGFHAFENEGLYRGAMLTHRVAYNPYLHIAKNFIALVNASLAEKVELPFSKTHIADSEIVLRKADVDSAALAGMRAKLLAAYPSYAARPWRIVLINPNASDLLPQRRWMPENFVAVMQGLLALADDILVVITGAPAERAEAETLRARVGSERCVNFAGFHALEDLPALYSLANMMLTNDSGPGHFSSVTDLHTFVLFGPETPLLYGSLGNSTPIYAGLACSPCVSATNHRKTPCRDNVCLRVIRPEPVLAKMRAALDQARPAALPG